ALTRSLIATYASVVAFFVAYFASGALLSDIENERLAGLLDPFGLNAFSIATRYWTVFDKNTRVVPFEGIYLWNRLLWLGVAVAILGFTLWKFQLTTGTRKSKKKRAKAEPESIDPLPRISLSLPHVTQTFGGAASWRQFLATMKLETGAIFKSIPFMIMLVLGVLNIWGGTSGPGLFGTPMYPVTREMLDAVWGNFGFFTLLIAAFYAGDLVWRERTLKLNEVRDAIPTPTWVLWTAKLAALLLIVFATLVVAIVTSLVIQTAKGYHDYELLLYAKGVLAQAGTRLALLAAFAFIVQVLFNQKFVGFLGVMLWFVLNRALPALDHEHVLYRFGSSPPFEYSDMNGYGHFFAPMFWSYLYWAL